MFQTSNGLAATSADIGVYNTWVRTRAAAGVTAIQPYANDFTALVSTQTVNARANTLTRATDTDVPIYWVRSGTVGADDRVADDYADFYDGSWATGGTGYSEIGSSKPLSSHVVWAGSNPNGSTHSTGYMGSSSGGAYWTIPSSGVVSAFIDPNTSNRYGINALSPVFRVFTTTVNTAPTAADNTVATAVDTPYTFTADDFGFADTDTGDTLASVKIVTVPTPGTLALDGTAVLADAVVTKAQIDGDMLTFTPVAGASGAPYTTFTFKVNDGTVDSAVANTMTIDVTAVAAEPPSAPATPIVSAVSGSTTSLTVSWTAPANAGRPDIDNYDVQYRAGSSGTWSPGPQNITTTTTTITGLVADTLYQARVRATNAEGDSGWSDPPGSGRTNTLGVAQTGALVSNTGQANSGQRVVGTDEYAQPFDTGNNSSGYNLAGIVLDLQAAPTGTGTLTITVREDSSGSPVRAALYTLVNPELAAGLNEFLAPENAELDARTTYWVVATYSADSGGPAWYRAVRPRVDAGAAERWAIDAPYKIDGRVARDGWVVESSPRVLQIAVKGTLIGATNNAPVFEPASVSRSIAENTAAGQNVGAAVTATDADNDTLSYTLGGTDAASFDFVGTTGQILTKAGVSYDHEAKSSYAVTVTASDGTATAVANVTISITDVDEPPDAPTTIAVSAVAGSTTSLSVSWTAPANDGKPDIDNYDVQYRVSGAAAWTDGPQNVTTTTANVTSLVADTLYEVQVRATNAEGDSGWSDPPGSGRTNSLTNNAPVFSSPSVSRSIAENTAAGQNVGAAVTATDADTGDTLAYTLGGTDMTSFDIVGDSGQIRTKAGVSYDFEAKDSYTVTVTASDGTATAVANVTISITDVDEPPDAPTTPAVTAGSGSTTSLTVSWTAPANAGRPDIDNYDVQYRAGSSGTWSPGPQNITTTTTTITGLVADTLYQARVRATNAEGDSGWSDPPGSGRTNTLGVAQTGALVSNTGQANSGQRVVGTDEYAQPFDTGNNSSGYNLAGIVLDLQAAPTGTGTLTITVREDSSGSPVRAALYTLVNPELAAGLNEFLAPENAELDARTTYWVVATYSADSGGPAWYRAVRPRVDAGAAERWAIDAPYKIDGRVARDGWVVESSPRVLQIAVKGTLIGATNNAPVFEPASVSRSIAENTAAGQNVGAAVTATDADNDTLSYTLGGTDAASFDFVGTTGQILTKAGVSYDHEAKSSYAVTVTASDGTATAVANVTISITDVDEPPDAPTTIAVSAVAGSTTSLSVSWTAPANDGKPDIDNYDVQYRVSGAAAWTDGPQNVTTTTANVTSLVADTLYEVQVRATNAEGDSGWSDPPGSGRTNSLTNNAPVFSSPSVSRSIAENTAAGQNVGAAVTATDADTGDTLAYTLGGTDMTSFDIVGDSGQIRTKAGVSYDFEAKDSYTVTVTASDGTATAVANVTISITDVDEPPDAPTTPAVTAGSGSTTSLTVSWTAPANAGRPDIDNYDVQYRAGSSGTWSPGPQNITTTTTTITGLVADTLYQARVRATNAEGDSGWSDPPGSGRTNTLGVAQTGALVSNTGQANSGQRVVGTDEYAQPFDTGNNSSGYNLAGIVLDLQAAPTGTGTLTITVREDSSGSPVRAALYTLVNPELAAGLNEFLAPENAELDARTTYWVVATYSADSGGPAWYRAVRPRVDAGAAERWAIDAPYKIDGRVARDGWVVESSPRVLQIAVKGTLIGATNNAPVFEPASVSRSIAENTAAGQNVGAAVTATDADNDTLSYTLGGTDAASFDFVGTTGQILTKAGVSYDHEAKSSYAVTVTASDGTATAVANVTISITDVDEPPDAPTTIAVSAVAGSTTSLSVSWTAPANDGKPDIDNYDVQYRVSGAAAWTDGPQNVTTTTANVTSLVADTLYEVQVRATNAEGDSGWSDPPGSGRTNSPSTSAPGEPESLTARAGDAQVTLIWTPPALDGGAPIERYQYRHSAGSTVASGARWMDVPDADSDGSLADERSVTVPDLDNGSQYAFEVRAVNSAAVNGRAASAVAIPVRAPLPPGSGFLVSNFGQPVDGSAQISVTQDIVGVFTTGTLGATLDSIELRLFTRRPNIAVLPIPSVTLYRASVTDTRATRGARVAALTAVAGSRQPANTAQTVAFAAPSGTRLEAGATYLVVLAGSGYVRVEETNSSAQDAGGASGWTIDGVGAGNSSPYSYGTSDSLLMSVNGTTARAQRAVREEAVREKAVREKAPKDEQQVQEQVQEQATSPDPDRGISLSTSSSSAIEGQAVTISVRRAGPTDRTTSVAVQVFDSALTGALPIDVKLRSGEATATATVAIPFDSARPASRTVTVRLASVEDPYSVGSPSSFTLNVTERDAALSVDDARVSEGPGATLAFAVTLDRTRGREVRVKYATSDGTATQGDDYTGVSGTLRFAPGETTKTVSVTVLDDTHNEGSETLTLTLSSPRRAVIDDDTAVGTIVNSDPLPDAWLSRFGRAASDQVVQSIGRRLEGGARESHLTVMGWRMDTLLESTHPERDGRAPRPDAPGWQANGSVRAPDGRIGAAGAMTGATRGVGAMSGPGAARPAFDGAMTQGSAPMQGGSFQSPARAMGGLPANAGGTPGAPGGLRGAPGVVPVAVHAPGAVHAPAARGRGGPWANMLQGLLMKVGAGGDVRAPGLRDMVMGSSFYYGYSPDAGLLRGMNRLTAWGESASTRFNGAEGKLSLDGEVNTAILGADGEWGRWLAGLALSYSEGEGGYRQASAKGGAVSSTLTGVNPYARYRLDERTSLWATLGYGSGRLTLTPDGAESALETDMTNAMAAFGGRGVLSMRAGESGQFELALRTDAMLTDTASMAVAGLSAGEGATSRIRLILEGTGSLPAFGGVLAPKVEAGLRYDGGDAETGAGLEIGGGLAYDKARLTVQVDGRVLLTHRDRDYEEWGYSLSFVYQPGEDGRGLRYQAGSQWGATQSGVQSLWSLQNAGGLANGARTADGQRYTAELGYGFGERRLWYPYVATESGGASSRSLRFGLKLNAGSDLEAGVEIGRRPHMSGQIKNDILLRWSARW